MSFPGRHSFTQFIEQLNEKANKYCICCLEKEATSFEEALVNNKERENKILSREEDPPGPPNNQLNTEANEEPVSSLNETDSE
ncbi:27185_t:CDS:2, partial [Dentiscutata erythropus]